MKRRTFISLLGGATATWPLATLAEQSSSPVIGFLRPTSPTDSTQLLAAWHKGLQETGYVEGQNVSVEYRWAENHFDRLPALAADLVARRVSVILAAGIAAAHTAKAATTTIPIVFAIGEDPVERGLVGSLDRPGGNVTGATFVTISFATKRLELLKELIGKPAPLGFLLNPKNRETEMELTEAQNAAHELGLTLVVLKAGTEGDIEQAFAAGVQQGVGGLLVAGDAFFFSKRNHLVDLAARNALPTAYQWKDAVITGGLMSYGPSLSNTYYQAGIYVARILKGEKPADLPVMLPTKFELVLNLKTAKALGLTVPPSLLATADEVIE